MTVSFKTTVFASRSHGPPRTATAAATTATASSADATTATAAAGRVQTDISSADIAPNNTLPADYLYTNYISATADLIPAGYLYLQKLKTSIQPQGNNNSNRRHTQHFGDFDYKLYGAQQQQQQRLIQARQPQITKL